MKRTGLSLVLALASVSYGLAENVVVYDNTTTSLDNNMPLLPEWRSDSAEVGDDVWLSGDARQIVGLRVLMTYRGTTSGSFDLRVRLRDVVEEDQTPGAILYESDLYHLNMVSGINTYDFSIPSVMVQQHLVWTVQAYNKQNLDAEMGPSYFNPATVGFSDDFFWQSDMGSPWTPYSWGGDPYANFGATLTAAPVPEPLTMLCVAPALALMRRRKRS